MKTLTITEEDGNLKVEPSEGVASPIEALIMLDLAKNAIVNAITQKADVSKLVLPRNVVAFPKGRNS